MWSGGLSLSSFDTNETECSVFYRRNTASYRQLRYLTFQILYQSPYPLVPHNA